MKLEQTSPRPRTASAAIAPLEESSAPTVSRPAPAPTRGEFTGMKMSSTTRLMGWAPAWWRCAGKTAPSSERSWNVPEHQPQRPSPSPPPQRPQPQQAGHPLPPPCVFANSASGPTGTTAATHRQAWKGETSRPSWTSGGEAMQCAKHQLAWSAGRSKCPMCRWSSWGRGWTAARHGG